MNRSLAKLCKTFEFRLVRNFVGAAGLLAPLAGAQPDLNLALLALSIGNGSLFFDYANHAGFWMVKESFGMSMG